MNCWTSGSDVRAAVAQRRDAERDALEPVEEIGPKRPAFTSSSSGAERRADEPRVDADLRRAADAHELAVLEEAQQLRLHGERHLADLVEEERPAAGRLDLAARALARAGERALLVAEELALEERLGDRRAVDRHERARAAMRDLVDAPREHLLARAALADQREDDLLGGDGAQHAIELAHRRRLHDGLEDDVDGAFCARHEVNDTPN